MMLLPSATPAVVVMAVDVLLVLFAAVPMLVRTTWLWATMVLPEADRALKNAEELTVA
jgi:hypothetical protein